MVPGNGPGPVYLKARFSPPAGIAIAKSFFRSLIATNPPQPPFNKGGNYKELLLKSPFEKGGFRGI